MKILIVNISDTEGGASRAAYRLHRSLLDHDIDSNMLVLQKNSDDFTLLSDDGKIAQYLNIVRPALDNLFVKFSSNRKGAQFSPSLLPFSPILNEINRIKPDIVHLHWINRGMLNIKDIGKIHFPIVWSLHDMWPFTGGCHYDELCGAYNNECGNCRVLGSNKEFDLSRKIFQKKLSVYGNINNMTIVGLSKWIGESSKNSRLLRDKKHITLPNPIDTTVYRPFDKKKSRELWGLPQNKKLILFGAMNALSDGRKGFSELHQALSDLQGEDIELIVVGSSKPEKAQSFGFNIHYAGQVHDDVSLVTLYSAVDVLVVPSLQENLSNVIMEGLSCGTPVVGFDVGGNRDMVEHHKNGYLAQPFDTNELKDGIEWVLYNDYYDELCQNAREKVLKEFDSVVVVQKYIDLYKEVLHD